MKANPLGFLASLIFGGLIGGLIVGLSSVPVSESIIFASMVGVAAFACGLGMFGFSFREGDRSANIRTVAVCFLVIFAIAFTILGLCDASILVMGCTSGLVLLIYIMLLAKISRLEM